MAVLKETEAELVIIKEGVRRKLIHAENLMMVVIDFENGPWNVPDPPHRHVHEQTSYVAEGEFIFFCEGETEEKLMPGDMFSVPSNKLHAVQLLTNTGRLVDCFNPIREEFL